MTAPADQDDAEPTIVSLTLLLEGGHRETVEINADHPALAAAIDTILHPGRGESLLQLPLAGGTSMLAISSRRIVGLISQPPLQIEADDVPAAAEIKPAASIETSQVLVIDGFLSASLRDRLLDYSLEHHGRFVPTTTSTGAASYRASLVLHELPELAAEFRQRVAALLPTIRQKLVCTALSDTIELQLTAHNDGHYYKVHNDNGSADTANRELTYVYYFHGQPKAFDGGELKVYDSVIEQGRYVAATSHRLIEPRDNRIVFFLARHLHEVLPIRCPSQRFEDSRFTINGWIHRQKQG